MQQHHHEEESMSDDDDPMGLDGQQQDERIQPTEEDMAASVERARRLYWQRHTELLEANDLDGLETTLDRNYSWLDFA